MLFTPAIKYIVLQAGSELSLSPAQHGSATLHKAELFETQISN